MKETLFQLVSFFNKCFLYLTTGKLAKLNGLFAFVKIKATGNNNILFEKSDTRKSIISIKGSLNNISVSSATINKTRISIEGNSNSIHVEEGVILRKTTIIIRGENCRLSIGKNSTFGSVRIVNAGQDNEINIGEGCLFSDNIEIWASDTHPIFNEQDEIINPEKPITIGNRVWVGSRAVILKGVSIGDDSIIGMCSLVTKNIPHGVIAAGTPCQLLKSNIHWRLTK